MEDQLQLVGDPENIGKKAPPKRGSEQLPPRVAAKTAHRKTTTRNSALCYRLKRPRALGAALLPYSQQSPLDERGDCHPAPVLGRLENNLGGIAPLRGVGVAVPHLIEIE